MKILREIRAWLLFPFVVFLFAMLLPLEGTETGRRRQDL